MSKAIPIATASPCVTAKPEICSSLCAAQWPKSKGRADPADHAVASVQSAELLAHVEALPDRLRAAVALRHVLGLSERETAAALGIRQGTVKSRLSRGLQRLRESMEETSE